MTNLVENIWRHADQTPEKSALREGTGDQERSWNYDQLRLSISSVMDKFTERGISRGDRVLLVLPTSAEFVLTYHAILGLGATVVTANPLCAPRELEYFIEDAGCSLALGWREGPFATEALDEAAAKTSTPGWNLQPGDLDEITAEAPATLAEVQPDDAAALLYTSGTTGKPKGAVLTHENFRATGRLLSSTMDLLDEEHMGTPLPLFHVFGQASVMSSVYTAGSSFSVIRPFDPQLTLKVAVEHKLTGLAGVPTMWNAMLYTESPYTPEDFTHMRLASSGGAALPLEVARAFQQRFGGEVLEGYGLTETTGAATFNVPGGERREGSVGRALPEVDIAVIGPDGTELPTGEVGEIVIDGPVVMKEYWNRPEATAGSRHGRWFLTGDLGRIDEDGFVFIVDRKKDLIIRGGYNVYPREVEEVLYTHPDVQEAAVAGVPDERLGEEVAAVVALRPGAEEDAAALKSWLGKELSAYKVPRIYRFVEALPKGATGKILKRAINRDDLASHGIRPSRETEATATENRHQEKGDNASV
ncbi:long-chain fatty acid--CoA ligase [Nesterenkonia salmonea]|uniref:Long-chain fatty acid--CoA ligase n=1 Tax=Nesterenkonia salmonea TaxID=1804987 RepID=A0A5R9B979_9MICC|nr:AMP-binding protein [Nesterenkonia salmonea]TLP93665.1 long-chain fatty acid--CoA ligase [Nesterenkonia salmonea]